MTNQAKLKPKQRGGKRPGSGRKPTGRTRKAVTVNFPPVLLKRIDTVRGNTNRSAYIASKLNQFEELQ